MPFRVIPLACRRRKLTVGLVGSGPKQFTQGPKYKLSPNMLCGRILKCSLRVFIVLKKGANRCR